MKTKDTNPMTYKLTRRGTASGVGWFSCIPERLKGIEEGSTYLAGRPNDWYMRRYLIDRIGEMETDQVSKLIAGAKEGDIPLLSLAYEACLFYARLDPLLPRFEGIRPADLAGLSPLIYIPWSMKAESEAHLSWIRLFAQNFHRHCPLPSPEATQFPFPFKESDLMQWKGAAVHITQMDFKPPGKKGRTGRTTDREAVGRLSKSLEQMGLLTGWESRPDALISPFAVERPWNLDFSILDGRHDLRVTGIQTGYGRGLNIHQARISCLMEIVERYSAFGSVAHGLVEGYRNTIELRRAGYEEMLAAGLNPLHPDRFQLEVPCRQGPFSWIPAQMTGEEGSCRVHVPAQLVFLFSNLDEPNLTSGINSTGFGAGASLEEAKLSALLEVLERDAEKVVPYCPERCFILEADDWRVSDLIGGMKRKGIQIQLLDITSEFGVPCYKAFIQGPGGIILKGTAASLDGKKAAVSAMTEIPYPYPYWFGAMPAPENIRTVQLEELPDYSTGDAAEDLDRLERLLIANGYYPVYVDLTRKEPGIPVVKALVPGLELMTTFDRFMPLALRQFGHYLDSL